MSLQKLAIAVFLLILSLTTACGPSDEELATLVAAEVERQVALIPPAPQGEQGEQGVQGLQGVEGPQGLVGPEGPQGLVGPQGPQGATGPQGRVGPAGPIGLQGPKGDAGPAGPAGPAGRDGSSVSIPKVLEVEELFIRGAGRAGILIEGGDDEYVGTISWLGTDGNVVAQIWGGSTLGMVLTNARTDGTWARFCIADERIGPC